MSRTRLVFSIILLLFSIIFTFKHHLGFSVGDTLLAYIGISPYTKSYVSGVHVTLFFGLGMLGCGFYLTRKEIMHNFPIIAKRLWIGVLILIFSYSFVTDKLMYVVKWTATGTAGISYIQNSSYCMYNVQTDGATRASCELKLKNYSNKSVAVVLNPDLAGSYDNQDDPLYVSLQSVQLKSASIQIDARKTFSGKVEFTGVAYTPLQVAGKLSNIVLDVAVDGKKTVFNYNLP